MSLRVIFIMAMKKMFFMKKNKIMLFGGLLHSACKAFSAGLAGLESSDKPNIILILADDLGMGDVSCYGGTQIPTPHMDSIAANGIRFANAYVTAPQCGPSRAGLMSGRYQNRFGYEYNTTGHHERQGLGLPLSEKTMADCLKDLGYKTAAIGKWHLGRVDELHPLNRGFDYFYGFLGGANPFFPDEKKGYIPNILRNHEPVEETEYLTFALARETCSFIEQNKRQPFFIYAAFNAPHTPLQAPREYIERFRHLGVIESPFPHKGVRFRRQVYAAMVSALDDAVGQILDQLKTSGVYENTLVYFMSDNGATELYGGSNGKMRGEKGDLYEGGVKVPFMLQWPAQLKGGRVFDSPVSSLDLLPTSVAAAGGDPANAKAGLDGRDLLPCLAGDASDTPHSALYWRLLYMADYYSINFSGKTVYALQEWPWKLVYNKDRGGLQLFNLADDPGETKNRNEDFPERAQEMQSKYEQWNETLEEPAWSEK